MGHEHDLHRDCDLGITDRCMATFVQKLDAIGDKKPLWSLSDMHMQGYSAEEA